MAKRNQIRQYTYHLQVIFLLQPRNINKNHSLLLWNPDVSRCHLLQPFLDVIIQIITIQTHTWLESRYTVLLARFLRMKLWMAEPESSIEPSWSKCSGSVTYVVPPSSRAKSEMQDHAYISTLHRTITVICWIHSWNYQT